MASSIKIPIEKVMDLLTKVKTKLSAPDANSASIIGYIDGQIEVLDAMKDEANVASGSRTLLEPVPTVPADPFTNSGVVKLDNVQLNKMIEEMKEKEYVNELKDVLMSYIKDIDTKYRLQLLEIMESGQIYERTRGNMKDSVIEKVEKVFEDN